MRGGEIKSVHFSKKKMSFGETSSRFILQSLGLRLPMYIKKLSTENIKLNLHVHCLLYLIIYIRTSKLKPKLKPKPKLTRLKSGSFLLIEIIKIRFQFALVFVKRDLFCTKNGQNKPESKDL